MQNRTLVLLVAFLFFTALYAQPSDLTPCGTLEGRVKWLQEYQQNPSAYPESDDTLYVPITLHIVGKDDGTGYISERTILESLCTLNEDFAPSAIQFFIEGEIHYINNSIYYEHNFNQGGQMMVANRVPNTFNCYIVGNPADNCGYSSYNQGIALANSCTDPWDHTWAHEAGHYFSLPHPFWGWEGYEHNYAQPAPVQIGDRMVERLDGQNCHLAGDGFCDTPPDYLNYIWTCDSEGQSAVTQTDPTGATFKSDGSLFMSYSGAGALCETRFSDGQMAAMRANLLTEKVNYLYNQDPMQPVVVLPLNVISPPEAGFWPEYQQVYFEWEDLPNATAYLLEASILPNFSIIQERTLVFGNSYTSTSLFPNQTFYWRIRPFNPWHFCAEYSEVHSFQTGEISGVNDNPFIGKIQLSPNPVLAGQMLQVQFDLSTPLEVRGAVHSLSGRVIDLHEWTVPSGLSLHQFTTESLAPGLYMLHIQSADGNWTQKIVVQP